MALTPILKPPPLHGLLLPTTTVDLFAWAQNNAACIERLTVHLHDGRSIEGPVVHVTPGFAILSADDPKDGSASFGGTVVFYPAVASISFSVARTEHADQG